MFNMRGLDYLFIALFIFFPLGMWKLIEIIIWLFRHVHIGLS